MTTTNIARTLTLLALAAGLVLVGCSKKEGGATAASASASAAAAPGAAPAAAVGATGKCKQAAEAKAKLKDPSVDPSTLGSVEFDKQDCESGKFSAGWADCVLGAKDYDTAKACK